MAGDPDRGDAPGDSGVAWSIIGTLLAGVLVWGGIGYLVDRWLGTTSVFLPIGMVVGAGAAMYLIIVRYGNNSST
jgi:ATP synthase protein I